MVCTRAVFVAALAPWALLAEPVPEGECAEAGCHVDPLTEVAEAQDADENLRVSLLQGQFHRVSKHKKARSMKQGEWPKVPALPTDYNGISWPELVFEGHEESRVFVMGDYGGMTCGDRETTGKDPNGWACHGHDGVYVKSADNTKDHPDRGRFMFHGTDDKPQQLVADQMRQRALTRPPHYALNGGDNFYFGGLDTRCGQTPMDQIHPRTRLQFDLVFEQMYSGVDVPFFSVFGNHDFGGFKFDAAWDQQIAFTWAQNTTKRWIMPGFYWHQRVRYPDADFIIDYYMVDTNKGDAHVPSKDPGHNICGTRGNNGKTSCASAGGPVNMWSCHEWFDKLWNDQAAWLEKHLNRSQDEADWQVIVSHFPPDQFGGWWFWNDLTKRYGIDLFVGSHRHSQEVHINDKRFEGLNWIVVGGGGGITSEWNPDNSHRGRRQYGFMDLTITKTQLSLVAIDERGVTQDTATITPRPGWGELSCKHYGCGSDYSNFQGCQCSTDCWKHGNCCEDYATTCPELARCEVWGCNSRYDNKKPCQCTSDCAQRGNCCTDYEEKCKASCDNYGCASEFQSWQACACTADCFQHNNCCPDLAEKCPELARCEVWGCNSPYDRRKPCQCAANCAEHNNCCPDHGEKCRASCDNYGCGNEFQRWQACSCSADCWQHNNCCPDFAEKCTELAKCEVWGCNSRYDRRKPCQCTSDCAQRGNCCSDHEEKCNPTCDNYGCGSGEDWQACSCSADCWKHNNCCADFSEKCSEMVSCAAYGCGGSYQRGRPCQCNKECAARGSCCSDFEEVCNSPEALAAEALCDTACEFNGQSFTCRERIEYMISRQRKSVQDAVDAINTDCQDMCNCTASMFGGSLLEQGAAMETDADERVNEESLGGN